VKESKDLNVDGNASYEIPSTTRLSISLNTPTTGYEKVELGPMQIRSNMCLNTYTTPIKADNIVSQLFNGERLTAPHPNTKSENHPLLAVRDSLFNTGYLQLLFASLQPATRGGAMTMESGPLAMILIKM
jgi:hypothetical protein